MNHNFFHSITSLVLKILNDTMDEGVKRMKFAKTWQGGQLNIYVLK